MAEPRDAQRLGSANGIFVNGVNEGSTDERSESVGDAVSKRGGAGARACCPWRIKGEGRCFST
jgi:hypothetical protein